MGIKQRTRSPDPAAYVLDKRRVREAFAAAADTYDRGAKLQKEVGEHLLEHLDPVRIKPRRILDVGAGTGAGAMALSQRYKGAELVSLDLCQGMLKQGRRKAPRWRSRHRFVCADAEALPMPAASVDLLFSNLTLQWCNDPDRVFSEFRRVLAPGALVCFSTFGPDTLKELRECWAGVDGHVHVHAFIDMHDLGDGLVRAGFADVVMDAERFVRFYADLKSLSVELKGLGTGNASRGRPRGLTGPGRLRKVREAYEQQRQDGGLPATYEVVYAHAWVPASRSPEVAVDSITRDGPQRR